MTKRKFFRCIASYTAIGVLLILSAMCFATDKKAVASADTAAMFIGADSSVTVTENCAPYDYLPVKDGDYGCKLTFTKSGSAAVYSELLTLNGDTNLISLVMLPSLENMGKQKADLQSFTVRLEQEDDSSKYIEISVNGFIDVFQSSGYSAIKANATGQTSGGEAAQSSLMPAADGHEGSDYLRTFGGNVKLFSFAGVNANTLEFVYNNDTGCLTAGNTATVGAYKSTIRRFKHAYIDPVPTAEEYGSSITNFINDDVTFDGFDAGKKVRLSVIAGPFANNASKAEILVYSVGGQKTLSPIDVTVPSGAVEGGSYKLPLPVSYASGKPLVFTGNYEVKGPDGSTVSSGTASADVTFLTAQEGNYTIVYSDGDNEKQVTVTALPREEAESLYALRFTDMTENFKGALTVPGKRLSVFAKAESGLDYGQITVKVSALLYSGDMLISETDLTNSDSIVLPDEGSYTICYKAVDYVGREILSDPIPLKVSFVQTSFIGEVNDYNNVGIGEDSVLFNPSRNDLVVFDARYPDMDKDEVTVKIFVNPPDKSGFVSYSEDFVFDSLGEYEIKYDFSYFDQSGSVTRVLNVYDSGPPVLIPDKLPVNTAFDLSKESNDNNLYLKAKTGVEIKLPVVSAVDEKGEKRDLFDELNYCEILPDGTIQDKTEQYKANVGGYAFTPSSAGVYVLRFTVRDSSGLYASLNYRVDVRNYWYEVTPVSDLPSEINASEGFRVPEGVVTDFFGQKTEGATAAVKLYYGGEVTDEAAAGKVFSDLKPGGYKIEYVYSANGETSDTFVVSFTIKDDVAPEITINGGDRKGSLGKPVVLASFDAIDNDIVSDKSVKVYFGEEEVDVYEGAFIPEHKGEYKVVVTASDFVGNVRTESYTVTVGGGLPVWAIVLITVGAVIVAGGVAVLVILLCKNKTGKGTTKQ